MPSTQINDFGKPASLVIVTGLSGAGKSSALNVLEDIGYFCIDNLPVAFLPKFLELSGNFSPTIKGIALVMDLREKHFLNSFPGFYRRIKKTGIEPELIFLEADDQTLIKRYSETRRKHPVAVPGSVATAVARERELLQEIRSLATCRVDTSKFTIHQFKDYIRKVVSGGELKTSAINISLLSFGFRNGLPLEADIVMDVRFLPNPYFIDELKKQSGLDPKVSEFVLGHAVSRDFTDNFLNLLKMLIPEYVREGKSYLTVAIGCTGGCHRSVAIVEEIGRCLREAGHEIALLHRDLKT
ncbi:MAG: RNase adapter RapZ [Deltaproteobacteria bacterium]|nr:RNase adapter RapZ [Deltaproteobacteria bacterium]